MNSKIIDNFDKLSKEEQEDYYKSYIADDYDIVTEEQNLF